MTDTNGAKRVAIYCRVSTEEQGDNNTSLATQEERCRQWAADHGHEVVERHVVRERKSGMDYRDRPLLLALLRALAAREFDVLLVYDWDRLSRKGEHGLRLLDDAEQCGVEAVSVRQGPDPRTPNGRLILFVGWMGSQAEVSNFIERTTRAKDRKLRDGQLLGTARAPLGYHWNDHGVTYDGPVRRSLKTGLIVDPDTAPLVRRMFAEYAGGSSLNKLSKLLAAQGVAAPRGGREWSLATLQGILRNRAYIGEARQTWDGQTFTLPCPALIDRDTFDAAQRLLDNNQRLSVRNSAEPDAYLLRGFVVCGHCGQVATCQATPSRGHRYRYYRVGSGTNHRACGHRFDISAPALDDAIWRRVVYLLTNADAWNDQMDRLLQDDGDPTPGDLADVERRVGEVERKRKNLLDALENEDDPRERADIQARRAALAGSLDALERERDAVLERRKRWARVQKVAFDMDRWRERRAADLHGMTVGRKRALLTELNARLRLWEHGHAPRWQLALDLPYEETLMPTPETIGQRAERLAAGREPVLLHWRLMDIELGHGDGEVVLNGEVAYPARRASGPAANGPAGAVLFSPSPASRRP